MKQITPEEIAEAAKLSTNRYYFEDDKQRICHVLGYERGAKWYRSQMQPEWVPINCVGDLPNKEGYYFTFCKVDWHPFYRIDVFCGRLSNAVNHLTGKPIYSHYAPIVLPQPPTK